MKYNADQLYNAALKLHTELPGEYPSLVGAVEGAIRLRQHVEEQVFGLTNPPAPQTAPEVVSA